LVRQADDRFSPRRNTRSHVWYRWFNGGADGPADRNRVARRAETLVVEQFFASAHAAWSRCWQAVDGRR
jgi:hypothetical protein